VNFEEVINKPEVLASGEDFSNCFTCGKRIPFAQWFARLPHQGQQIMFCRPRCLELFLEKAESASPNRAARGGRNALVVA
jgi:hypothetical protein